MLALLGLIGVALAGTAFIALPADQDADGIEKERPELDEETVEGDLIDFLEQEESLAAVGQTHHQAPDAMAVTAHVQEYGSQGADDMAGSAGDDYLNGRDGDDTLTGADGADQLMGGDGDDALTGGDGDDILNGYIGDDHMAGGAGQDRLQGGDGDDYLDGYDDDDDLLGGWGDDTLVGGAGQDNLQGSEGNDVVDGAYGEAVAERDYLNGSEGFDHLIGNNGDVMTGGEDADTFEVVSGRVQIMDYTSEDVLVLNYDGPPPDLSTQENAGGITLLADGEPVADLVGLTDFDVSGVQLIGEGATA